MLEQSLSRFVYGTHVSHAFVKSKGFVASESVHVCMCASVHVCMYAIVVVAFCLSSHCRVCLWGSCVSRLCVEQRICRSCVACVHVCKCASVHVCNCCSGVLLEQSLSRLFMGFMCLTPLVSKGFVVMAVTVAHVVHVVHVVHAVHGSHCRICLWSSCVSRLWLAKDLL